MLPPFNPAQNMSDDELIDILIYATPRSWMREMDRQGFDPVTKTLQEVVTFMERIEQSEDFDGQRVDHSQKSSSSSSNKHKKAKTKGSARDKYCLVHGRGSHTSDECEVLKKRAEEYKSGKPSTGGRFGNKTWSRKADESTKSSKKDLAAFIKKAVASGVKKELNSVDKKRKAKSDDDYDLHAFDEDLKGFNYSDMENLKIDSDDESTGEVSC